MNINRDNYEMFFLLYTDNELSVAEKMTVDEFVQANPDLQEELVMLQQAVLKPDAIVFDNKALLLKKDGIDAGMQDKLLLHLDNELAAAESRQMNVSIALDAAVRKEWNILQQTKLSPELVVFENKQFLYKKEEGRVIAFPWLRVAAAAVFIGFGLFGGLVYFNKQSKMGTTEISVSTATKSTQDAVKPNADKHAAPAIKPVLPLVKEELAVTQPVLKKSVASAIGIKKPVEKVLRKITSKNIQPDDMTAKANIPVDNKPTNNLPTRIFENPHSENINKNPGNEIAIASVTNKKQATGIVNPGNDEIGKNAGKEEPAYATTASYTGASEETENNRVLFMNEEKIKKTKLGGFFRKVKRVLERSANIKPGDNNIKVANMEFAIQ